MLLIRAAENADMAEGAVGRHHRGEQGGGQGGQSGQKFVPDGPDAAAARIGLLAAFQDQDRSPRETEAGEIDFNRNTSRCSSKGGMRPRRTQIEFEFSLSFCRLFRALAGDQDGLQ